ncbi:MAG: hypothetical protein JXR62_00215 [Bacilli bacterium]|nr:hypothetical protein [Bacilli bacterium]
MNTFEFRHKKSSNYFEGWYIRFTDSDHAVNIAVIFGVTNSKEDPHAFIQFYDGNQLTNSYYRFDLNEFIYQNSMVTIGENTLSMNHLSCHFDHIKIHLHFSNVDMLQGKKSAMSFLVHAPLQCFQEVNMMNGDFSGEIIISGISNEVSGKIYMEKTYGDKFPAKWIWLQSNHFKQEIAVTFAYGKIPFLRWKVNGFMAILHYQKKEFRFSSYNFARLKIDNYNKNKVKIILRKKAKILSFDATLKDPVELIGPTKNGVMNLTVMESINSVVNVVFSDNNNIIFDEIGSYVGLEIMNQ